MGRFGILLPPSICDEIPPDCWSVIVDKPSNEDVIGSKSDTNDCWQVHSTMEQCWQVSGACATQNPEPLIINDIELADHDIFKAFAIHISHGFMYLAVEMREPDDTETDTYYDGFGSCTIPTADGKYAYYPSYKATEIVEVSDIIFGNLPHEVRINEHGYKYIVMDEMDINFDVYYKNDMGFRFIRGYVGTNWEGQERFLARIDESVIITQPELIGNGCMLTQHESSSSYTDPLIFKATDGSVYLIDPSTLEKTPTGTTDTNYMLDLDYGMKYDSATRFNFYTDTGESDAYPLKIFGREFSKAHSIMQNSNQTIGFPEYSEYDSDLTITLLLDLKYLWFHEAQAGGWTGSGGTGHIVGGEPYNPDLYYVRSIPFIPNPIPPTSSIYEEDILLGMRPESYRISKGIVLERNIPMSSKILRMNVGEDFFVASDTKLYFLKSSYADAYPHSEMTIYQVCSFEGLIDYCYDLNVVYVADGTSLLKVHSTFNML